MSFATRTNGPLGHHNVQICNPVVKGDAAPKRDDDQLVRVIKGDKALCVSGSNAANRILKSAIRVEGYAGRMAEGEQILFELNNGLGISSLDQWTISCTACDRGIRAAVIIARTVCCP